MNDPWFANLTNMPDELPTGTVGRDHLYDLVFTPYKTEGITVGSHGGGVTINPFSSFESAKIAITLAMVYDSRADYVVGFGGVPSATVSLKTDPKDPKIGKYWDIKPDTDKLMVELAMLPQGDGAGAEYSNRMLGHLHLKDIDLTMARHITYACCRDPFHLDTFLHKLKHTGINRNFLRLQLNLNANYFMKGRNRYLAMMRHRHRGHGKSRPTGHQMSGTDLVRYEAFNGNYVVSRDTVVVVSTSATGTGADPCIKFVGYMDEETFIIEQVIVMPYATP